METNLESYSSVSKEQMYASLNLWTRVFSLRKADVKSLHFAVIRFLMKLFSSANIDTVSNCRWYFDFQLPSEVLVKKSAKLDRNLPTIKPNQ